jgi:hypothetical protein
MARRPIQLGRPELAAEIAERYRKAKEGLQQGRWKTSPQLSRWLKEKHGLEVKNNTALIWLKKSVGCCGCHGPGIPSEAATWSWSSSKQAWGRS